ncbi:MAG: hypothetical protein HFE48_05020 [Clostridia bacterium]|nr:hypothetical protein [Clostridia bacterium]
MKKNKLLLTLLSLALASTVVLAGCGGDSYSAIKVIGEQDTTYAVHSQGGNAVQYGNYIYFINGTAGYTDEDGNANIWNKVVKGALYRAELEGTKNAAEFDIKGRISSVTDEYIEFKSTAGQDYDENAIEITNTQLIAPKVIGTSGYTAGGIFIYDNYVYYASPNNQKNKAGDVQYKKTDFFRTSLDGKTTQKLLTTEADSESSPYAFYKQADKVYLVALDGTTLKSVVMNDKKVEDTLQIAENVTSAYLPVKSDYYRDDKSVSVEDYVYFVRKAENTDSEKQGSVLEFMRPNGEDRTIWLANGQTSSVEAVRDGVVFYRTAEGGDTVLKYTNLHEELTANSEFYKNYEQSAQVKRTAIEGYAMNVRNIADYTYLYPCRPAAQYDVNTNDVYVFASTGSVMRLFGGGNDTGKTVYEGTATVSSVHDGYAYFSDSSSYAARVNIFEENTEPETVGDREIVTGGLPIDVCAGYVVYFGKIDDWANGYALFKKLPGKGPEGSDAVFVGLRSEADVKPEEEEEE